MTTYVQKKPLSALNAETVERIYDGTRVQGFMPYIEAEVTRLQEQTVSKMYAAVIHNELTPEKAVAGWYEVAAYRNLLNALTTRVKVGQRTGEAMADQMKLGDQK
jgi:hypothetical protein